MVTHLVTLFYTNGNNKTATLQDKSGVPKRRPEERTRQKDTSGFHIKGSPQNCFEQKRKHQKKQFYFKNADTINEQSQWARSNKTNKKKKC